MCISSASRPGRVEDVPRTEGSTDPHHFNRSLDGESRVSSDVCDRESLFWIRRIFEPIGKWQQGTALNRTSPRETIKCCSFLPRWLVAGLNWARPCSGETSRICPPRLHRAPVATPAANQRR